MNKIYLFFLLFFCFYAPINAQKNTYRPSINSIQEKVFVHIDRPAYLAGETMWFKINLVNAKNLAPLDLSKVVYLEVVDNNNNTPIQTKISVSKGFGNGAVYLPLSLKSGNYIVRAYTNWMKNFGAEHFFEEEVTIVNTYYKSSPTAEAIEIEESPVDIQFFPEGGSLVYGLRSKVAFRMVDKDGKGVDFVGALVNEENDTICLFKPSKFGIGYFFYTPELNSSVKAIIKSKANIIVSYKMPVPLSKGYVMQVADSSGEEIQVSIESTENMKGNLTLVIGSSQGRKVLEKRMMEDGKVIFSIDKNKINEGVSQITVFNDGIQPLAERLYFKYPARSLKIKVNADSERFSKREKIDLKVSVTPNTATDLARSNLSMAIYQVDSLNNRKLKNMYHYLWLSSDLKGRIESPEFYFENITSSTIGAIDNLMLTHGWRKFSFQEKNMANEGRYNFIPEYEGLTIKGNLEGRSSEKHLANTPIYLASVGKIAHLYGSRSDEDGNFYFITDNLFGNQKLVLQSNEVNDDKISQIKFEDPFSKSFSDRKFEPFILSKNYQTTLSTRHVHMQTQNVYWGEKNHRILASAIDSSHFYEYLDNSYALDNYTRFPTMEEVMREYVPEVVVRKPDGNFNFRIVRAPHILHMDNPLVLLNNIPVFNVNKIIEYNPLLVKQIDIIKDGYILEGEIVLKGVLNYKTYTNKLEDVNLDPETTIVDFEGLQIPRDFYSPMYGDLGISSTKPDFRNLLFWEPSIVISDGESEELSFYTSDLSGNYLGVIQGINDRGEVGYTTFSFEVSEAPTRE